MGAAHLRKEGNAGQRAVAWKVYQSLMLTQPSWTQRAGMRRTRTQLLSCLPTQPWHQSPWRWGPWGRSGGDTAVEHSQASDPLGVPRSGGSGPLGVVASDPLGVVAADPLNVVATALAFSLHCSLSTL